MKGGEPVDGHGMGIPVQVRLRGRGQVKKADP